MFNDSILRNVYTKWCSQASVLCGFRIPFQLIYEGVQLDSLPFEHPWAVLFELRHVIGCSHAEPISAKLSQAKVKAAHESSELHPNFIYSFNMIFLPILL